MKPHIRQDRTIVVPFASPELYDRIIDDCAAFRKHLYEQYARFPELFPSEFEQGFRFHGFTLSKKLNIRTRRILLKQVNTAYQLRPSFVLPYMTAKTEDVSRPLSLRQWAVPYWKIAEFGGRNAMFWYRQHCSLGRYSIVGTTIKHPDALPKALIADEKHTKWYKDKVFLATTVADGCMLGAAMAETATEVDLRDAYGVFAEEAKAVDPNYEPKSVTLDGWDATHKSWKALFSSITIILCFLHGWLSILKRCRRKKELRWELGERVWNIYKANNFASFGQRVRRLREWAMENIESSWLWKKVMGLCGKAKDYKVGLQMVGSPRTSNGVDRLMDHQDRQLYAMRNLHSLDLETSDLLVRGMAQMWNFHEYGPWRRSQNPQKGRSPFEDLNGFRYHDDWLQNFNIASSLQRKPPKHKIR